MTLLLSFTDIPLYKWGYVPISQSTFSYSQRNFRHLFWNIEYSAKKIMENFLLVWLVLGFFFSIHLICSLLVFIVHVLVCSVGMHYMYVQYRSVQYWSDQYCMVCSVLVYLCYGLFIGISEFILCGKMSNIEQFFWVFLLGISA